MGFSTSGATAIVFVGMLVAAGIAYPVLQTAHDERLSAIDDRDDRTLDIRNSDITLEGTSYDDPELTVNVTNTGSTTLSISETDLLVDGVYVPTSEWNVSIDGTAAPDRELWQPGETLSITVEPDESPERVKIVTEHGIAETAMVEV